MDLVCCFLIKNGTYTYAYIHMHLVTISGNILLLQLYVISSRLTKSLLKFATMYYKSLWNLCVISYIVIEVWDKFHREVGLPPHAAMPIETLSIEDGNYVRTTYNGLMKQWTSYNQRPYTPCVRSLVTTHIWDLLCVIFLWPRTGVWWRWKIHRDYMPLPQAQCGNKAF